MVPILALLCHNGKYQVGHKGDELRITDFEEALEFLKRQPKPYWRRPNYKGNRGIVTAVEWGDREIA